MSVNALVIDLQMTSLEAVTDSIGFGVLSHSIQLFVFSPC